MCNDGSRVKDSAELADVFKLSGDSYIAQYKLSVEQHKAVNAICNCRTAALGGNVQKCSACGTEVISYNSCRNRHCPKCQALAKARWLAARQKELLPVEYFHVVFTMPHEINLLVGYNKALIYNILFKAAWLTMLTLGKDEKRLGGLMGMLAALHTWGQNLLQHIHLHCIVPGGALTHDQWIPCKPGYLFPVQVMSCMFKKIFVKLLRQAYTDNELKLQGVVADLTVPENFSNLMNQLLKKKWCVYSKRPFDGAKGAVDYLAKYVYKTAISNSRILTCDNEHVTFKWRDYADNNKIKIMKLKTHEFIRRFLIHVLPSGFMRIRSFGFLANPCKAKNIQRILTLLQHDSMENCSDTKESSAELMLRLTGVDITICSKCRAGKLHTIGILPNFKQLQYGKYQDTS